MKWIKQCTNCEGHFFKVTEHENDHWPTLESDLEFECMECGQDFEPLELDIVAVIEEK